MGYSLAVKFKNSQDLEKMNSFYMSNLDIVKDLSQAEGRHDVEDYSFLHANDRLTYSPKIKNLLGYDGKSGIPYYLEVFICWMAIKSGYKNNEPFFYYDSEKVKIHKNDMFNLSVNEKGIPTADLFHNLLQSPLKKRLMEFKLYNVEDLNIYAEKIESIFNKLESR